MGQLEATLLSTLPRTEVRSPEQYEELTNRRAHAAGYGTLAYRLREPGRVGERTDLPLSTMGNRALPNIDLAVVHDRVGTDVAFTGALPRIGLFSVRAGSMHQIPAGRAPCSAKPGQVLVCATDPGQRVLTADGTVRVNLWLKTGLVTRHLERLIGDQALEHLVFAPPDQWPAGVADALTRLVNHAGAELADPSSFFARGIGVAEFTEMAVSQLIEGVPHTFSDLLHRQKGRAPIRSVRRAEAYMRANLQQTILLEDIARAAGCSTRALTGAYREHAGRTVAAALRDMRLDAARAQLLGGDPALTVAAVAMRFGFSNPGRFATQYRARFGESPARARAGAWPDAPGTGA